MFYFFALLLMSSGTPVFATTAYSPDIFTQTTGKVTATAQFVNRAQVVVSVENNEDHKLVCRVSVETTGYSSGPFERGIDVTVWSGSVNASVDSVKGNQEFGAVIKSIWCHDPPPPLRFPRGIH